MLLLRTLLLWLLGRVLLMGRREQMLWWRLLFWRTLRRTGIQPFASSLGMGAIMERTRNIQLLVTFRVVMIAVLV